jgi:TorA maturation chaperone TorD
VSAQLPTPVDPLAPEERARANMYALIGRLFYGAPDADLLASMSHARDSAAEAGPPGDLERAWRALQDVCAGALPAALKLEYDTLFVGVGKAEVTPYTSHYITHSAPDRHLVELRGLLEGWGLARSAGIFEVEDHVSALCDVMRFLIEEQKPVSYQRLFFERYVRPAIVPLTTAVMAAASAAFYTQVAAFVQTFCEVEKAAFNMDDATSDAFP